MDFKNRAIDEQDSTYKAPSSNFSYFAEQARRAGISSTDYGRAHEFIRNPGNMREAIQRELEKERIREEIIVAEIARKRLLEAEVRREMLIERDIGFGRADGFSFLSASSSMLLEPRLSMLHQPEGRSLEERIALSLEERLGYSARREIGGLEPLPFQRNVEPKISEVMPLSEVRKEKVILLAKPDGNLSGAKRKAVTPPLVGGSELSLVGSKKKAKEEWSCAICQVSATSERGLNEHLQGKKHKTKEAGLRAQRTGKNFGIGLFPKKTPKPTKLAEIADNTISEKVGNIEGESLQFNKTRESLLQIIPFGETSKKDEEPLLRINQGVDDSKKENGTPRQNMQKTKEYKKKKFKFWCEMCQAGAFTEKVMNNHKKGKKHVSRLQELNQDVGAVPCTQLATQKAIDAEGVNKDGKWDASEKVQAEDHQAAVEVADKGSN